MEPSLAGTEVHSLLLYGILAFISILIGIVGFFLTRVLGKVDAIWDKVLVLETNNKFFVEKFEDITLLKRDQNTIWRQVDALGAKIK